MSLKTKKLSILAVVAVLALLAVSASSLNGLLNRPAQRAQAAALLQTGPASPELISAYEGALAAVYEKVNPSVVNIDVIESGSAAAQNLPQNHPMSTRAAPRSNLRWVPASFGTTRVISSPIIMSSTAPVKSRSLLQMASALPPSWSALIRTATWL